MSEYRRDFLEAVERDRELWRSLDVRLVAVFAEGAWRNLVTRVTLTGADPKAVPRISHQVRTPEVRVEQHVLPFSALEGMLEAVERGLWLINEAPVLYSTQRFESGIEQPYQYTTEYFHRLDLRHIQPAFPWSGYLLQSSGDQCSTILQRVRGGYSGLEAVAQQCQRPFATFDELTSYILGMPTALVGSGQASTFEVFAAYEVRLDRDRLEVGVGEAFFRLLAASAQAMAACHLQVMAEPPSEAIPAASVLTDTGGWREHGVGSWLYDGVAIVDAADAALFVLRCGHQTVEWVTQPAFRVGAIPVPLRAYEDLDPDLEVLGTWLRGEAKGRDQERFEQAIGRLFLLAGWQVDVLQDKRLSNAVDLLAYDARQNLVLAVECTLGALDANGKLGKLAVRLGSLRQLMPDVEVVGVVATAAPLAKLARSERRNMKGDGLLLLHGDAIAGLLSQVRSGTTPAASLEYLRTAHPAHDLSEESIPQLLRRQGR